MSIFKKQKDATEPPAPDAAAVIGGLDWYRTQFRRSMKLALALTVALSISMIVAALLLLNQPKPRYFAATPDLRLAPMVPLDQPLLTQEGLQMCIRDSHGPRASVPIVKDIRETADSSMLAFLDRVPPDGAVRLRMKPQTEQVSIWKYNGKHYIRTNNTLMWPAWSAVVNGAGNTRCYETPATTRIMLSINGQIQTLVLNNGQ